MYKKNLILLFVCLASLIQNKQVYFMTETTYADGTTKEEEKILYPKGKNPQDLLVQTEIIVDCLKQLLKKENYKEKFEKEINAIISTLPEELVNINDNVITPLEKKLIDQYSEDTIKNLFNEFGSLLSQALWTF